jgi:hypothetical protein
MVLRYSAAIRQAQAAAIVTDAGTNPKVLIYQGTQPASVATAAGGTLLATLPITGALGTAASGVVTLPTMTVAASASGTAQWFRITKTDGTTGVADGSVTVTGGGGDMTLNSTTITSGGTVTITAGGTITTGNP